MHNHPVTSRSRLCVGCLTHRTPQANRFCCCGIGDGVLHPTPWSGPVVGHTLFRGRRADYIASRADSHNSFALLHGSCLYCTCLNVVQVCYGAMLAEAANSLLLHKRPSLFLWDGPSLACHCGEDGVGRRGRVVCRSIRQQQGRHWFRPPFPRCPLRVGCRSLPHQITSCGRSRGRRRGLRWLTASAVQLCPWLGIYVQALRA